MKRAIQGDRHLSFETVAIAHVNERFIEYKGQRVVTYAMIDHLHGRPDGTARRTLNTNRKYFEPGKDFIALESAHDIRSLGLARANRSTPARVILVTESGYRLIAKSLQDATARKNQCELTIGYFHAGSEGSTP